MAEPCCGPGSCEPVREGRIVRCYDLGRLSQVVEQQQLFCRFSNNVEVPANYDKERGCLYCCPAKDQLDVPDPKSSSLTYEVVAEDGTTLLQRLLSQSEVEPCGPGRSTCPQEDGRGGNGDTSIFVPPATQSTCCGPRSGEGTCGDSGSAEVDSGFVVRCDGVQLPGQLPRQQLSCRFSNSVEVPAEYDAEQRCLVCRPAASQLKDVEELRKSGLSYDVVDGDGTTVLQRLLSASDVERWSQLKGVDCQHSPAVGAMEIASKDNPEGEVPAPPPSGRPNGGLRPFVIITISYLLFTITDGAVRMIVLFHAYSKGFSAMDVAIMFSMYEAAGVVTNFLAGIAGARWGIRATLVGGLCLQLGGIGMLYGWQDEWSKTTAIIYVTIAQVLCGIAKDLTKLGGKTVTKLVTPDEKQNSLFKLVSFITGFKNSLKGGGYFLGSVLITISYFLALSVLMGLIAIALPIAIFGLTNQLGRTRKENLNIRQIFQKNYNVNALSLSRLFLFGSRDLWFEVPLPFFMRDAVYGLGWGRAAVGAALAIFIIVYGQIQSWTPQLVTKPLRQSPPNKWAAMLWCALLSIVPTYLGIVLLTPLYDAYKDVGPRVATLLPGLIAFALLFAVNSSIHSYLIVRYSEGDKVAMNVGFYYMSNAAGRMIGTLASGALYSYVGSDISQGFAACFLASICFALVSASVDMLIRDNKGGLACGPCLLCCGGAPGDEEAAAEARADQGQADAAAEVLAAPAQ